MQNRNRLTATRNKLVDPPPGGSRLEANFSPTLNKCKPQVVPAGAVEGKGAPHPGRVHPSLWLPEPLAAEGKGTQHLGRGHPSLWLPEPLSPGKAQNAGATESALLLSTQKLEPHSTQGPLHIEQPGA